MEILKKKVLICEDKEEHIKELMDSFNEYHKEPSRKYDFVITPAKTIQEVSEHLKGHPDWDVVVIDREFPERDSQDSQFWEKHILKPLFELFSDAIRIIFTANSGANDQYLNQNLIEAMRMGAWDYIDKNIPRDKSLGDSYEDLVVSVVKGLIEKEKEEKHKILSDEAFYWIKNHSQELYEKYQGNFVGLIKKGEDTWECKEEFTNESLFNLIASLEEKEIPYDKVHIFWVEERR